MPAPILDRRRLVLLAPAGVLALGLAGAGTFLALRPSVAPDTGPSIGGPFALQDGDGRTVTDADFRGRWTLVYFGYTNCPEVCPTSLQSMANAVDLLPERSRKDVALLFITIDPARDTPAVMKDYVANFETPITALSGTQDAVTKVAREYRVYYSRADRAGGGYDMDHSSIIYLMDPKGRFAGNFTGDASPERMAAKLRTVL